jgi:hypothetical protein
VLRRGKRGLTTVRRTGAEKRRERTYICEEDWC